MCAILGGSALASRRITLLFPCPTSRRHTLGMSFLVVACSGCSRASSAGNWGESERALTSAKQARLAHGQRMSKPRTMRVLRQFALCFSVLAGFSVTSCSRQDCIGTPTQIPAPTATQSAITPAPTKTKSSIDLPQTDDGLPGAGPIRRAEWFQQVWIERKTSWLNRTDADQQTIVFLGDSITQLWGDDLGGSFPEVHVANRGISGDTSRGVLIRVNEDVIALHPRAVVLLIGTNDIEEDTEPRVIAGNVELLTQTLERALPRVRILLCEVFPSSASKRRPAATIRELNGLYGALAARDHRITLVHTWSVYADENGDAKASEFPDLLHPNAAGYAKWAQILRPELAKVGAVAKGQ